MRRNVILLVVAVAIGVAAAWFAAGYLRSARVDIAAENDPIKVLVATRDIPKGTTAEEMVAKELAVLEDIPRRFVAKGALSSARAVSNQVLAVPISAGEQLSTGAFTFPSEAALSFTVPENRLALSVDVNEVTGVSGMLQPGDTVVVFASFKPEGGLKAARTDTLIPKAKVLAVGQSVGTESANEQAESGGVLGADTSQDKYTTVTLSLKPEDAARLVFARENGTLHMALVPQTAPTSDAPESVKYGASGSTPARAVME